MIRVVVIESEAAVRQQLVETLQHDLDIRVIGEAEDGIRALTLLERLHPDVAVLALRLPDVDGLHVLRALATRVEAPRLLALSPFERRGDVTEAIRLGARGVLLRETCEGKLVPAVRRIMAGELVLDVPEESDAPPSKAVVNDGPATVEPLTPKEREVLRLMCAGLSNREIAQAMGRVEGTVKNHVSTILAKLGVRQRTQAVLRALGDGLV